LRKLHTDFFLFFFIFIFPFIVVLGGGTLWHLQKFLQCTNYIILEYFPYVFLWSSQSVSSYMKLWYIFKLFFVQGEDRDTVSVSYMWMSSFLIIFVEDAIFSLTYVFGPFLKNHVAIATWVLYSVTLVYGSVYVSVPYCFCYYCSAV
jgi:hypothetical protein